MQEDDARSIAAIPMQTVGPILITGQEVQDEVMVPLATFETPLWPSVNRGAKVSTKSGGIAAVIQDDRMTRSIILSAPSAVAAVETTRDLKARKSALAAAAEGTSRFAKLQDIHTEVVANLIYLRIEMTTGDAAGHNMVTGAAEGVMNWVLAEYPDLAYGSISGNYCADKKATAINGILGRGKSVVTEIIIPQKICSRFLKTTAAKVTELNIRKNLVGTTLAGGIRSANAHYANMLLAFYLATGQDAANIVEGSQGITYAEDRDGDLYFSCTVPNIIVGTVGNGKEHAFVRKNLSLLGCAEDRAPGANSRRLAVIAAATVLCGELSLLAAQTNPGELMSAHRKFERASASDDKAQA